MEDLTRLGMDLPAFANGLPGGFFIYEAHGTERILFANEQMSHIFGCDSVEEFLELVGGTFMGVVYHEDRMRVRNSIWSQIDAAGDGPMQRDHVTYRIVDKQGTLRYMDEYGRMVRSTTAGDLFFVFVAEIATVPRQGTRERDDIAAMGVSPNMDALTGLSSMHYYHAHSAQVLAQAAVLGTPMVDVFLDIDHFRTINYRLGYEGGNEVLQRVATILQECFPNDLLARFSDDHFVLVTAREGVEERLERAHELVSRIASGMTIELKAGIYELGANEVSIPFAHDRAKAACASVKGRYDRFLRFYDESLAMSEDLHTYIVDHVEQAVREGWICNYYQPVVRVGNLSCCSLEALSRWVDPHNGMLPPARYVHVLEEARLVHLLDTAVVDRACADIMRTMERLGTAVPVSLNFSPTALALIDIPALLEETIQRYNVPRRLLHVEITESSLTEDPELLRHVIGRLHKLGYEVWMDDFGSGYSSLNLLKDYDFDVLKVDMEFLRGMEGNERSKTIVRSITTLAHSLGMRTLVEGVETTAQLEFLREMGVDKAQGYLFSPPVAFDALLDDFFPRHPPQA